jgi:hypothetical protein
MGLCGFSRPFLFLEANMLKGVNVRFPLSLEREIRISAAKLNISKSEFIRTAAAHFLTCKSKDQGRKDGEKLERTVDHEVNH